MCYLHNILLLTAVNCGDPGTPINGEHNLSSTTYNSVVTYTCDVGYRLQGVNSRTCQSNGQWNGSVPQCISEFIVFCVCWHSRSALEPTPFPLLQLSTAVILVILQMANSSCSVQPTILW